MTQGPLNPDSWLAEQLGCPAYHLTGFSTVQREELPNGPAFVDVKIGVDSVADVQRVEALGFRVVDINMQLTRLAAPLEISTHRCRFANSDDEMAVRSIAAQAISKSRFHLDPQIPNLSACNLKEAWVGNYFKGKRGDWMVVAEEEGRVCGFCQVLARGQDSIVIDLIAVTKDRQGRGVGASMMSFASQACLGRHATMILGTQLANFSSLAFYRRLGFEISGANYVLHLHIPRGDV